MDPTDNLLDDAYSEIASLGEAFSPKSFNDVAIKAGAVFLITSAATKIFSEVFSFALSQGTSFNTQAIALKQIKHEIEQLNRKVDKILNEPLKTATKALKHAMNYLEDKDSYKNAFLEFEKVLENAGKGFEYVDDLETKMICKRLVIFSRFMCNTYNADENKFVPLQALPESKKKVIAGAMKIDVDDVLEEFEKTHISRRKRLLGKREEEQQKYQDTVDGLLKLCLPVMWHYLPKDMLDVHFRNKSLLRYVPEGIGDAANIRTKDNGLFFIWKERNEEDQFALHWSTSIDHIESILKDSWTCLTSENVGERRFYFDENNHPLCIKESEHPKMEVYLTQDVNYPFFLWTENEKIKACFGNTYNLIIRSQQGMHIMKYAPSFVKYECRDKFGNLMLHEVCKNGLHHEVPHFTNNVASIAEDAAGFTPLHLACISNDLKTVKEAMKHKGHTAIGIKTRYGKYPVDMTKNDEITKFLENLSKVSKAKRKMLHAIKQRI